MIGHFFRSLLLICFTFFSLIAHDNESHFSQQIPSEDPVTFALFAEENSAQLGQKILLAIDMTLVEGWHTYWKNPGSCGMPMRVEWNLPEGFSAGALQWPYPSRLEQNGAIGYGFEKSNTLLVELNTPKEFSQKNIRIEAEITWLACSDSNCLPGESKIALDLPISSDTPLKQNQEIFAKAKSAIPSNKVQFSARQDKNYIELQIGLKEKQKFQSVQFFPAGKGVVDEAQLPTLKAVDDDNYLVLLKSDGKSEVLQGVLVLQGDEKLAFDVDLPIEISDSAIALGDEQTSTAETKDAFAFEGGIAVAILFAFLGGLLLNLMPCVFPVISFKILSFVNMAGKCRRNTLLHGTAFSMGVIVSFWVFAGLLVLLQAYGHEAGWGFQLKQPIFVGFLTILLFIFSLSLFGVFEFGLSLTAAAGNAQQKVSSSAFIGSFFSGVLATAVATPCSGPFMAAALGYAATLPVLGSFSIFTALGIGMAAPYFLLSAFPQYLRFLPKPGPWMVTFKQVMGFLLIATVLWLVNVFASETGESGTNLMLIALFVVAIGSWIFGISCSPINSKRSKRMGFIASSLCLLIAGYLVTTAQMPKHADNWENFTVARFEELRKEGKPVFIDFTATWCLTCQTNHWSLTRSNVEAKFNETGVVKMKADWTRYDPEITAMLRKFGRNSVPLYVLYGSDQNEQPQVLPQILTPGNVMEALENLKVPENLAES